MVEFALLFDSEWSEFDCIALGFVASVVLDAIVLKLVFFLVIFDELVV